MSSDLINFYIENFKELIYENKLELFRQIFDDIISTKYCDSYEIINVTYDYIMYEENDYIGLYVIKTPCKNSISCCDFLLYTYKEFQTLFCSAKGYNNIKFYYYGYDYRFNHTIISEKMYEEIISKLN